MGGYPGFPSFQGADTSKTKEAAPQGALNITVPVFPYQEYETPQELLSKYTIEELYDRFLSKLAAEEDGLFQYYVVKCYNTKNEDCDEYRIVPAAEMFGIKNNQLGRALAEQKMDGVSNDGDYRNYQVHIITSKNGSGLRQYFDMIIPRPFDLIFFLENNEGDKFSERVMLCSMGTSLRQLLQKDGLLSADSNYVKDMAMFFGLDVKQVAEMLDTGEIKGYSYLNIADFVGKGVYYLSFMPAYLVSKSVSYAAEQLVKILEHLKFEEHSWLPGTEGYRPVFFSLPNFEAVTGSNNQFVPKDAIKDVIPTMSQRLLLLTKELDSIEQSGQPDHSLAKNVWGGLLLHTRVFINRVRSSLNDLAPLLELLNRLNTQMINAFLCGLVNGFLDAIAGLVQLIKWVFDVQGGFLEILKDIKGQLPDVLEVLDSLLQALANFSFANLWAAISKGVRSILHALGDAVGDLSEAGVCKTAYFIGSIMGFLVELLVEVVITDGVAAAAKILEAISAKGGRLAEVIVNLFTTDLRITLRKVGKKAVNVLMILVRFLSAGKEQVQKFILHLFDEIKAILGIGLRAETEELFGQLGYEIVSKTERAFGALGGPTFQKYQLMRDGKVAFEGTKAEIEVLENSIKGLGKEAAEKEIREAYNLKRFGFKSFNLGKEGLEHIEYGNVRISVVDSRQPRKINGKPNPKRLIETYEYIPGSGKPIPGAPYQASAEVTGLHVLSNIKNGLVKITETIGTFTLKTGETIKQCKVAFWVEELGQWMEKEKFSTFFPKEWSMEKIQQKIFEASENIVEHDDRFFAGITKDGIRIEFFIADDKIVNDIAEIATAFIVP